MSGKSRFAASGKSKSRSQHPIFGSPPVLSNESPASYRLLLERLYTDLEPQDIVEEGYLHDIAYWTWEKRRLRRMKICLIEATHDRAGLWEMTVPPSLNELVKIDRTKVSAEEWEKKVKAYEAECEKESKESKGIEEIFGVETKNAWRSAEFELTRDTFMTRAVLDNFDVVERFDQQIIVAENRCIVIYREMDRRRVNIGSMCREKVQNIEDAEFKVIKSKNRLQKNKIRKNAA